MWGGYSLEWRNRMLTKGMRNDFGQSCDIFDWRVMVKVHSPGNPHGRRQYITYARNVMETCFHSLKHQWSNDVSCQLSTWQDWNTRFRGKVLHLAGPSRCLLRTSPRICRLADLRALAMIRLRGSLKCWIFLEAICFLHKREWYHLTGDVRFDIPIMAYQVSFSQRWRFQRRTTVGPLIPRKLTEAVGAIHKTGGLGAFYVGYGTMALCPENGTATGGTGEWT